MFLFVPAAILSSHSLNSSEKLLMALMWSFNSKGYMFFAEDAYLNEYFGSDEFESVLAALVEKKIAARRSLGKKSGYFLTDSSIRKIESRLDYRGGKRNENR